MRRKDLKKIKRKKLEKYVILAAKYIETLESEIATQRMMNELKAMRQFSEGMDGECL